MEGQTTSVVDVSVLTPSWNYGRFIEDALLSVLGQKEVLVQHVVQDGGSSDETLSILSSFDAHIDWRSEPDRGQSHALNKALSRTTGKWIGWLNADEFYLPGSLSHLVRIGERSGADVVYGDCVFVDVAGRLVRLLPKHRFSFRVLRDYGCYISSSSAIFRRSSLGDAPWGEDIRRIMDWDLYMKLVAQGARFVFSPHPVGAFRVHDQQVSAAPPDEFRIENATVAVRHARPGDAGERWKASRIGRWLHPVYKVLDGAYGRQFRASSLRGRDVRWFRGPAGERCVRDLMRLCYKDSGSRAIARI